MLMQVSNFKCKIFSSGIFISSDTQRCFRVIITLNVLGLRMNLRQDIITPPDSYAFLYIIQENIILLFFFPHVMFILEFCFGLTLKLYLLEEIPYS